MNSIALLNRGSKKTYDLVDEYTFIDNIGSYIKKPNGWEGKPKAILLQRYLNAIQLRVDWENRDKAKIVDYLTKTLAMAKLSGDVVV
jgi:hypothetical protein